MVTQVSASTAAAARIAILISGRGSNMLSLVDSLANSTIEIALVAANKPCDGLRLAAEKGIPTQLLDISAFADRSAQEAALGDAIAEAGADWICLAGYMAILSPAFVNRFPNRIINIHPSLLPAFKGLDTHRRALEDGAMRHGASVHLVTAALDDGPILLQAGLDIRPGENETDLAARVLRLEHALYPFVMMSIANGDLAVSDGKARWVQRDTALTRAGESIAAILSPSVIWPASAGDPEQRRN